MATPAVIDILVAPENVDFQPLSSSQSLGYITGYGSGEALYLDVKTIDVAADQRNEATNRVAIPALSISQCDSDEAVNAEKNRRLSALLDYALRHPATGLAVSALTLCEAARLAMEAHLSNLPHTGKYLLAIPANYYHGLDSEQRKWLDSYACSPTWRIHVHPYEASDSFNLGGRSALIKCGDDYFLNKNQQYRATYISAIAILDAHAICGMSYKSP